MAIFCRFRWHFFFHVHASLCLLPFPRGSRLPRHIVYVVHETRYCCWCHLFVFLFVVVISFYFVVLLLLFFFFLSRYGPSVYTQMEQENVVAISFFFVAVTSCFRSLSLFSFRSMYYALLFYGAGIYRPEAGGGGWSLIRITFCRAEVNRARDSIIATVDIQRMCVCIWGVSTQPETVNLDTTSCTDYGMENIFF